MQLTLPSQSENLEELVCDVDNKMCMLHECQNRVQIHLKFFHSNFLFIYHVVKVGIWFCIIKTVIQAKICVASCLRCGAFWSAIQVNLHPVPKLFRTTVPA